MSETIMDLRVVEARRVLSLIRQEAAEWEKSLHWERQAHVRLVSRLLRRRQLSGLALVRQGKILGKVLFGFQGSTRSVEFPYIQPRHRGQGRLAHLLHLAVSRTLDAPQTRRVEVSFFPLGENAPGPVLARLGFKALPRQYLIRVLEISPRQRLRRTSARKIEPLGRETSGRQLGKLLQVAYEGSGDALAADFYRTVPGCASYLSTLFHGNECGQFAPPLSSLVRGPAGRVVGILLGTTLSGHTAHVAQLAVHPSVRGRGIGTLLLNTFHQQALQAGYHRTTLLVSCNNPARRWYLRTGYLQAAVFLSYFWDAAPDSPTM